MVINNPKILLLAILAVPALWIMFRKARSLERKDIRKKLIARTVFFTLAYVNLVAAASGICWGSYLVGVQKSSGAVAFVFDVSNSMMAKDTKNGDTRLHFAATYAKNLLDRMNGESVSVIIAKGEGITAIPLTGDYQLIESLLDVLSPSLMTAPGTSLEKGIESAISSFPSNFSHAPHIWVFTDGEETDSKIESGILSCMEKGIPVTIVGFGSKEGTDVTTGDGKTIVHSSMKQQDVEAAIERARKKSGRHGGISDCSFIVAEEKGSGTKLLNQLKPDIETDSRGNSTQAFSAWETKDMPRFKLFLGLSLLFFALGLFVSERKQKNHFGNSKILSTLMVLMIFTGCSNSISRREAGNKIARSNFLYHTADYSQATAGYLECFRHCSNQEVKYYALYNLATTYLACGEKQAAWEKYCEIPQDAPDKIRFAAFYNRGLIACDNGDYDTARLLFQNALKIDGTDLNAKINLELCLTRNDNLGHQNESQLTGAQENQEKQKGGNNSLFEHIKENDKKQWKNTTNSEEVDLSQDY